MSFGIKFVKMPEDVQERIINIIKKIEKKEIDSEFGADFFMKYFTGRLSIVADNHPESEILHKQAKGQKFSIIVNSKLGEPLINDTALIGDKINQIIRKKGADPKTFPAIIFEDVDTFLNVLLSREDMGKAIMDKRLKITKLGSLLKWAAPLVTPNDPNTLKKLEEQSPKLMIKILDEIDKQIKGG